MAQPAHHRPRFAAILLVPIVVAVVLTLFAWPNASLEPRDLPVGVAGQPAAATALTLRSTGFFDGAAGGGHVAVLAVWTMAGLAAVLLAAARTRRRLPATAPVPA